MTDLINDAYKGDLMRCVFAIEQGEDIRQKNTNGNTPLIQAARNGHLKVLRVLMDEYKNKEELNKKNIDVNKQNAEGDSALMIGSKKGLRREVEYLVDAGADIHLKNDLGQTAIMYALANEYTKIADHLISKGADINDKNKFGMTSLMCAVSNTQIHVVSYLLEKNGIDIDAIDHEGKTAYDHALENNNEEIVNIFSQKKSKTIESGEKRQIEEKSTGQQKKQRVKIEVSISQGLFSASDTIRDTHKQHLCAG